MRDEERSETGLKTASVGGKWSQRCGWSVNSVFSAPSLLAINQTLSSRRSCFFSAGRDVDGCICSTNYLEADIVREFLITQTYTHDTR